MKHLPLSNTSKPVLISSLATSISTFERNLRLALFFHDKSSTSRDQSIPPNHHKPLWFPPPQPYDKHITQYIDDITRKATDNILKSIPCTTSIDSLLNRTLRTLKNNKNIVIKPADKNLGVVILDSSTYAAMCLKHLNDTCTYARVHDYQPLRLFAKLSRILFSYKKLYKQSECSVSLNPSRSDLANSLLQLKDSPLLRVPPFYVLPKIHKTLIHPIPGRPIVSSINSVTYYTSLYLHSQLLPIVNLIPTICTSTLQLISDLSSLVIPSQSHILCADVVSLYPNIPTDLGLKAIKGVLSRFHLYTPSHINFLISLLEFVLTENYCMFDDVIYQQLTGTAMGTPTAPSYANIFLYSIELRLFSKYQPIYYMRYIDDIFAIFTTEETALSFVAEYNNVYPSITLDAVTSGRSGIILDLFVQLSSSSDPSFDTLSHKVYQKPLNIYQYITPMSEHTPSTLRNFVQNELFRYRIGCTSDTDFFHLVGEFCSRLQTRGYLNSFLLPIINIPFSRPTLLESIKLSLHKSQSSSLYVRTDPILVLSTPRRINLDKWQSIFELPLYLTSLPHFQKAFKNNNGHILIGRKNPPTINSFLVRSLFSSHNTLKRPPDPMDSSTLSKRPYTMTLLATPF